jgi:hypothetical protein
MWWFKGFIHTLKLLFICLSYWMFLSFLEKILNSFIFPTQISYFLKLLVFCRWSFNEKVLDFKFFKNKTDQPDISIRIVPWSVEIQPAQTIFNIGVGMCVYFPTEDWAGWSFWARTDPTRPILHPYIYPRLWKPDRTGRFDRESGLHTVGPDWEPPYLQ